MATDVSTTIAEFDAGPAEDSPRPYSIGVDLYGRIVASGVFGDEPPFFLREGRLVTPIPRGDHFRPYLMPVDLYEDLIAAGVFLSSDRLYLWKGVLVEKMTKGPYHCYSFLKLLRRLIACTPEGWHVRPEMPISLRDGSEPEPDFTVVRGAEESYLPDIPKAGDVALAIEVSDSSLKIDVGSKRKTYADVAIAVYWVINLNEESIDVYTDLWERPRPNPRDTGNCLDTVRVRPSPLCSMAWRWAGSPCKMCCLDVLSVFDRIGRQKQEDGMNMDQEATMADAMNAATPEPYRINIDVYEKIVKSGVFGDKSSVFLWDGVLVEPPRKRDEDVRPYRIPLDLYEDMVREKVFDANDPPFLWKGLLVRKMSQTIRHSYVLTALGSKLFRALRPPADWHVELGSPIAISDHSVPEPDFAIFRGANPRRTLETPSSRDVSLVIEVADVSLAFDSGAKLEAYAAAAIPVYWLVNLPGGSLDVYSQPAGATQTQPARYQALSRFGKGDAVPVVLDGREVGQVAVSEIL